MDTEIDLEGVAGKARPGEVVLVGRPKDLRLAIEGQRADSPDSLKHKLRIRNIWAQQLERHDTEMCFFIYKIVQRFVFFLVIARLG